MAQALSQSEVDALLEAVGEENDAGIVGQKRGSEGVQPYDLASQDKVIRGRMPILEIIYERFVRSFRVALSNSLRKVSSISIVSTDLMKFSEFVNTLPIPSCICIMRFNELRGPALLVFESKLAYAIIDSSFGGSDKPYTKVEGKEFTQIELSFMKKVMDMAIENLEEAWMPIHPIDAQYIRTEINPQFVGVVPSSDVVIATTLEVEFELASGTIMVIIPYSTIEPIKQKLGSTFQVENYIGDSIWMKSMNNHLMKTKANVVVELGDTEISIGELLTLEKNDVIPLNQTASGEASIFIEGIKKMKCLIGNKNGNKAVQITEIFKSKQEDDDYGR